MVELNPGLTTIRPTVKQALYNHSFSVPIFNTGSTGITRGWLHQGGLLVNEFACPCKTTFLKSRRQTRYPEVRSVQPLSALGRLLTIPDSPIGEEGSVPRERVRHLSMEFILWETTVQLVSVPSRYSMRFHFVETLFFNCTASFRSLPKLASRGLAPCTATINNWTPDWDLLRSLKPHNYVK